jgi:hypothetical protein
MRNRYKIYYRGYRSFIRVYGRRYYFDQIDMQTGIPYEYLAFFKVVDIDYGVDDYAIVEELKED